MIIEKTKAEIKHETPPFGKPLLGVVFVSKMEIGYFLTTADCIYNMSRKTLIYVEKVNKKTFNYKIADWVATRNSEGIEVRKVYIHYPANKIGKLKDIDAFVKIDTSDMVLKVEEFKKLNKSTNSKYKEIRLATSL
jgi:hypothetical protein